jgi:hypothetical protein
MLGIFLPRIESIERDALISADTRGFVDGVGIDAVIIQLRFARVTKNAPA